MVLMLPSCFVSMLMATIQLPGTAAYESQMATHTSTENTEISLAREFAKTSFIPNTGTWLIRLRSGQKRDSKRKWADREYHVQEIK